MTNCSDRSIANVNFCGLTSGFSFSFFFLFAEMLLLVTAMFTSLKNCLTEMQADTVTVICSMGYSNSPSQANAQCSEDSLSNFNDQTLPFNWIITKGSFKIKCTGHLSEMTVHTAPKKRQVVVTSLCSGQSLNCPENVCISLPTSFTKIHYELTTFQSFVL